MGAEPDRVRQLRDRRLPVGARGDPAGAHRRAERDGPVDRRPPRAGGRARRTVLVVRAHRHRRARRSASSRASSRCSNPTSPTRSRVSTASLTGLTEAVPLIIILVVTVFSGRARPTRGEMAARLPLPGSGRVARLPLAVAARRRRRRDRRRPELRRRADRDVRDRHHHRVGRRGLRLRRPAVAVPVRARRLRRMGGGTSGQQLRRSVSSSRSWSASSSRPRSACSWHFPPSARAASRWRSSRLALSLVFSALIFQNASMTGGFDGHPRAAARRSSATTSIRSSTRNGTQR